MLNLSSNPIRDGGVAYLKYLVGDNALNLKMCDLEPSGAPVHKLDGLLCLDVGDGGVDIPWHHVPPVQNLSSVCQPIRGQYFGHMTSISQ